MEKSEPPAIESAEQFVRRVTHTWPEQPASLVMFLESELQARDAVIRTAALELAATLADRRRDYERERADRMREEQSIVGVMTSAAVAGACEAIAGAIRLLSAATDEGA